MKALLVLFTTEHLLMCAPMFILCYNIWDRNYYLDTEFYGQLHEELVCVNHGDCSYHIEKDCPSCPAACMIRQMSADIFPLSCTVLENKIYF